MLDDLEPSFRGDLTMANFRPLYDRILVKRVESETMSAGGLHIPESAKEKPQRAEVIAIGDGRITDKGETVKLIVKPGDKVLFGKYSGDEVKLEGIDHIILRENDILAIID
jgi:chaperonin GroES